MLLTRICPIQAMYSEDGPFYPVSNHTTTKTAPTFKNDDIVVFNHEQLTVVVPRELGTRISLT